METTPLAFAAAARQLGTAARLRDLDVPTFRSPPRLDGVSRSLRRRKDGGAVVSVGLKGRPSSAVLADMVEGIVVANRLEGRPADLCRQALWLALDPEVSCAA